MADNEYSPNEIRLFNALGMGGLLEDIDPVTLYQMATQKAFCGDWQGSPVEALRRAANAIQKSHNRHTPEWEELVAFDIDK